MGETACWYADKIRARGRKREELTDNVPEEAKENWVSCTRDSIGLHAAQFIHSNRGEDDCMSADSYVGGDGGESSCSFSCDCLYFPVKQEVLAPPESEHGGEVLGAEEKGEVQ